MIFRILENFPIYDSVLAVMGLMFAVFSILIWFLFLKFLFVHYIVIISFRLLGFDLCCVIFFNGTFFAAYRDFLTKRDIFSNQSGYLVLLAFFVLSGLSPNLLFLFVARRTTCSLQIA